MTLEVIEGGDGIPAEPDWKRLLHGRGARIEADRATARRYWSTVVAELRAGDKLAAVNGHAILRLVTAWILYDRAALEVARHGPIIPAPKTGTPMHSPWWTAMRAAQRMAADIEAELALSPRRRASGGKVTRPRRPTGADRFLRPVPGEKDPIE
jgi:P27 family predicted phage terminase small subunit